MLPVADRHERLIGVVSISDIIPIMLNVDDRELLKKNRTPFENIVEELHLKRILESGSKDEDTKRFEGSVHISTDFIAYEDFEDLTQDDIIICNMSEWEKFIHNAGGVIIGGVSSQDRQLLEEEIISYAADHSDRYKAGVFCSEKSVYELVKILAQTTPINDVVHKEGLEYFVTYETIDDVRENMMSSVYRRFPVVDENGKIQGMMSRSDLVTINKKKAILVDHNERGQSIEGIEDIEILEIIDHHRVADVQTIAPLYFRVEPVGCTCTIVARMYEENEVEIPKEIAGLMLSAIISDTLLFNSPTCTPVDVAVAKRLEKIVGFDARYYGMKMIAEGSNLENQTPFQILNSDRKKFMFGKYKVTISQINTGDFDGFFHIFEETLAEMERICEIDGFNLFVLLVTDVVVGGTEIVPVGDSRWIVENAFDVDKTDRSRFLPDVFSRKKQVVPKLMNAARL